MRSFLAGGVLFALLAACVSIPRVDESWSSGGSGETFVQVGVASWYGPKFHGRKTASGEIFDMHALTAAHRTLPFGTLVRVTYLKTGKSVVVRINDRGPWKRGRIIDLSYAAARKIGLVRDGTGRVRLEVVRWPSK